MVDVHKVIQDSLQSQEPIEREQIRWVWMMLRDNYGFYGISSEYFPDEVGADFSNMLDRYLGCDDE